MSDEVLRRALRTYREHGDRESLEQVFRRHGMTSVVETSRCPDCYLAGFVFAPDYPNVRTCGTCNGSGNIELRVTGWREIPEFCGEKLWVAYRPTNPAWPYEAGRSTETTCALPWGHEGRCSPAVKIIEGLRRAREERGFSFGSIFASEYQAHFDSTPRDTEPRPIPRTGRGSGVGKGRNGKAREIRCRSCSLDLTRASNQERNQYRCRRCR